MGRADGAGRAHARRSSARRRLRIRGRPRSKSSPNAAPGRTPKDAGSTALIGIDMLLAGPMMQHIVIHLATVEDAQFERIKTLCLALGEVLVRPLAETLRGGTARPHARTADRILLAFGASAQRTIERLKSSPNAAVRRTAIQLMRAVRGHRRAARSHRAARRQRAAGPARSGARHSEHRHRQGVSGACSRRSRPEASTRGTPSCSRSAWFATIARRRSLLTSCDNVDHPGRLTSVYLRAIEAARHAERIRRLSPPLSEAFNRPGEWWAPRRTSTLRAASAAALARVGTPEAFAVLEDAVANGPRGLRNAARAHLQKRRRPAEGVA